jgi:hypothetical protein
MQGQAEEALRLLTPTWKLRESLLSVKSLYCYEQHVLNIWPVEGTIKLFHLLVTCAQKKLQFSF